MHILIYGANGWIGNQFSKFLTENNILYTVGNSRVDNIIDLIQEIDLVRPTHIFSFIGRTCGIYNGKLITTIDFLEKPGNLNLNVRDNLFGPLVLAFICKENRIHYSYMGTGCIYQYDNDHDTEYGFSEYDKPNFTGSGYSTVKGYTDQLMQLLPVLNLRIRMPITAEPNQRNFITKITSYEKICSIPNSMTVLSDFFPVWLDMMKNYKRGTFNCTNPGVISHNEILSMYKEIVDPNFEWVNFTIEEQDAILDSKRSNNYLDTTKLVSEYPLVPDIKESIKNILFKYRDNM